MSAALSGAALLGEVLVGEALLGVALGPKGSARQRYAVAMGLYQAGRIGAELLEAYRTAAADDSLDPALLLADLGLAMPVPEIGGGFHTPHTPGGVFASQQWKF